MTEAENERRPDSQDPQPDHEEHGQVSEASETAGEQGGADATDKSTGTAPNQAGESS